MKQLFVSRRIVSAFALTLGIVLFALTGCSRGSIASATSATQSSGVTTAQSTAAGSTTTQPLPSGSTTSQATNPGTTATQPASSGNTTTTQAIPTVSVTAGRSTVPLPGTVPLPLHSVLLQEYAATLNAHSATAWGYDIAGLSATPASVVGFYKTNMPNNGWTATAVPSGAPQGKYGGTVLAYTQNGQICTIAAGMSENNPRLVGLVIAVSQ